MTSDLINKSDEFTTFSLTLDYSIQLILFQQTYMGTIRLSET